MSRDDDDRRGERPAWSDDADAPITPAEQARAQAFARHIDDLLDGEPPPPAMDADDRALLDTAAQVQASTRVVELDEARRRSLIDGALERALTGRRATTAGAGDDAGTSAQWPARRRRTERVLRVVPWAVAALAAAAAVFLFVTRPAELTAELEARATRPALPLEQRSRPADPLIGRIPRSQVDGARGRIDAIWADRMAGYRALTFGDRGAR